MTSADIISLIMAVKYAVNLAGSSMVITGWWAPAERAAVARRNSSQSAMIGSESKTPAAEKRQGHQPVRRREAFRWD